MIVMLCRNRVADFDRWMGIFASHAQAHKDAGLRLMHLWHDMQDPNDVFFLFEVTDMERAQAFIGSPAAETSGAESGVLEGEYRFLESGGGYG
jgi:hypothetical protein